MACPGMGFLPGDRISMVWTSYWYQRRRHQSFVISLLGCEQKGQSCQRPNIKQGHHVVHADALPGQVQSYCLCLCEPWPALKLHSSGVQHGLVCGHIRSIPGFCGRQNGGVRRGWPAHSPVSERYIVQHHFPAHQLCLLEQNCPLKPPFLSLKQRCWSLPCRVLIGTKWLNGCKLLSDDVFIHSYTSLSRSTVRHLRYCFILHMYIQLSFSVQWWRICLPCRRHKRGGFNPWVGKIPWRRACKPL